MIAFCVLNLNNIVGFLEQKSVVGPLVALIVEQVQSLRVKVGMLHYFI